MKHDLRRIPLALAVIIPFFTSPLLQAAFSGYIKFGDIKGEARQIATGLNMQTAAP